MSPNLAQLSRQWMSSVLLTGMIVLLPPQVILNHSSLHTPIQPSFATLIQWGTLESISQEGIPPQKQPQVGNLLSQQAPHHKAKLTHQIEQTPPKEEPTSQMTMPTSQLLPKISGAQKIITTPSKNKSSKHQSIKKRLQPPTQLTLFDTVEAFRTINPDKDEVWGHHIEEIDIDTTICLFFNNPNGLKLTTDPQSIQYSLSLLSSLGAGGICLAETNINWGNYQVSQRFWSLIKQTWQHSTYTTSHGEGPIVGEIQPGGTLTTIMNKWTSRVLERGTDPFGMGRWTYITLRGKEGRKILLVTAYRVCVQSPSSVGPTTSTNQQFQHLSKQFRKTNTPGNPNPRNQFIVDLQAWLEVKVKDNYFIILSLDANEGIYGKTGHIHPLDYNEEHPISTKGHDGSLLTLMNTCGLCDPLTLQHIEHPPPPTYNRGNERIDYILVSIGILLAVQRSGILPYDQYFISDHRPCYLDFDSKLLFGQSTSHIAPPQYRGLQLYDPRIVKEYQAVLEKQIKYHKLDSKIQELMEKAESGTWDDTNTTQYEHIDQLFTQTLIAAEHKVSR